MGTDALPSIPDRAGVDDQAPTPTPASGWVMPGSLAAVSVGVEGFGIAGIWPRCVAYLIDSLLASAIPYVLIIFALDWTDLFRYAIDAAETGSSAIYTLPLTVNMALVAAISLGISFAYFVGFWSSARRATPGMRLLQIRVVESSTNGTLSLGAAIRRWIALGMPFSFLALVAPLAIIATIVTNLLPLVLLLTTMASDRHRGLHDRWAGSLVIRARSSGAPATALGCLALIGLAIAIGAVVAWVILATIGPDLLPLFEEFRFRTPSITA